MIKINLLVAKKEKKRAGGRREILVLIVSVVILVILLIFIQWSINREKGELLAKIESTKKEINYYKSLAPEVQKAKEAQRVLQEKLNIINTLSKERGSPAKILEQLSINKPERIQIESLKKGGTKLEIEGIALDDETIANFMTNLRKSMMFKNVDLIISEQIIQSQIKLKKFILSCEIVLM